MKGMIFSAASMILACALLTGAQDCQQLPAYTHTLDCVDGVNELEENMSTWTLNLQYVQDPADPVLFGDFQTLPTNYNSDTTRFQTVDGAALLVTNRPYECSELNLYEICLAATQIVKCDVYEWSAE